MTREQKYEAAVAADVAVGDAIERADAATPRGQEWPGRLADAVEAAEAAQSEAWAAYESAPDDDDRVTAEIRRVRDRFPNWTGEQAHRYAEKALAYEDALRDGGPPTPAPWGMAERLAPDWPAMIAETPTAAERAETFLRDHVAVIAVDVPNRKGNT